MKVPVITLYYIKKKSQSLLWTTVRFIPLDEESILPTNIFFSQGLVAFSSQGDRIALTQIEQLTDNHYVKLGYYDTQADNLTWLDRERWVGECLLFKHKQLIIEISLKLVLVGTSSPSSCAVWSHCSALYFFRL